MLSCDACPVKKMLPLDRLATANPCLGEFHRCPVFQEVAVRLAAAREEPVPAVTRKVGSP
ncbi:MAG TPA: hypothetical protein VM364_18780 [Vicinamibacterales bacterium]|nr:hypothetical protein [Vicinamibacterales bacterium]